MKRILNTTILGTGPLAIAALLMTATQLRAETDLGKVTFQTSCEEDANAAFQDGMTLLHHMMYVQAESVFTKAIAADDGCGMLYWGVAMSNFHPLWPGRPSDAETQRGMGAAETLKNFDTLLPVEAGLAGAVLNFYDPANAGYRESITAWALGQAAAYETSPSDIDTAAFYALSQLATAPRGDKTMAQQTATGDLLDAWHAMDPGHPGVIHYAIHAYDNPPLAMRGLYYAQLYDSIAPSVPHALHMPSHIFVRLGQWDETVDWNIRSAEAAIAQPDGDVMSGHYAHAMDYRIYAHLQRGEIAVAQAVLGEFLAVPNHQPNFGAAYALAAAPARTLLEAEQWEDAANLPDVMHPSIPWEKFPQAVSIRAFTQGIGAIRSGDEETAGKALAELAQLRDELDDANLGYWTALTDAQMLSIEAWRELAHGNAALAVQLQTKAADIEDAAGKAPVTPGHVLPARELLGDLFAEIGDREQANMAYEATLLQAPNRRRSLNGLNR